jgi:hypothetical protein
VRIYKLHAGNTLGGGGINGFMQTIHMWETGFMQAIHMWETGFMKAIH